jgi:hypothetical protein
MRIEVFVTEIFQMVVSWVVTPCSLVGGTIFRRNTVSTFRAEVCTAKNCSSYSASLQESGHSDLQGLMQADWNK